MVYRLFFGSKGTWGNNWGNSGPEKSPAGAGPSNLDAVQELAFVPLHGGPWWGLRRGSAFSG